MGKAKMYGMNKQFIPNSKADMRHRKNAYQRPREIAVQKPTNPLRQEFLEKKYQMEMSQPEPESEIDRLCRDKTGYSTSELLEILKNG